MGGGSGIVTLYSSNGLYNQSYSIVFNFADDATTTVRVYVNFKAPGLGEYYFTYFPIQTNIYQGSVKIALQQSFVQSITGINDFQLIIGSILAIILGIILIMSGKKQISGKEGENILYNPSINLDQGPTENICPIRGNVTDSRYCDDCGSLVREVNYSNE